MGTLAVSLKRLVTGIFALLIAAAPGEAVAWTVPEDMPEPNPPMIRSEAPRPLRSAPKTAKAVPSVEWTFHKTPDNRHPDPHEQQLLWLMNRARANPAREGEWLANSGDPDVIGAVAYFNVDLDLLRDEFAAIEARPPAAFDVRLYAAAKAHSDDLIARDAQDHTDQFARVTSAGFSFTALRGNVFSYAKHAVHGHAGFNIDWGGGDDTGMQPGRGHRLAVMSMDGDYTNAGLSMVSETDDGTRVGPLVTTGNYAHAREDIPDHHNRFLVGTVFEDLNGNATYDPGEGFEGITVTPDRGTYFAVTADSGGYALPVESGVLEVTFSGARLGDAVVTTVYVGDDSVLCDLTPADHAIDETSGNDAAGDTDSSDGGGGCFIDSAGRPYDTGTD
ncbi:hypothetical protein JCM14469_01980 [Desulfatiferula olefinivorans]